MGTRTLAALHALGAAALAAAVLLPLEPLVGAERLLPALAGAAAAVGLILAPALRAPGAGPAPPLEALAAVLAAAPIWVVAYPVSGASLAGAGAAALAVLGCFALGLGIARAGRTGALVALVAALALSIFPPLLRFASTALYGRDRPWLRFVSPVELPAAALAPAPGGARKPSAPAAPRSNPPDVRAASASAGLFRRGIPVRVDVSGPYFIGGGEPPWYEALSAGPLYPVLHDRPPVGGPIDWQPVLPFERLSFEIRPEGPERRRTARGWKLTGPAPPAALSVLAAFDEVAGAPPAFRVLLAHRAGAPRVEDPALDPVRYDTLPPPRFPGALRRRLALTAAAAGALVALALISGPKAALLASLLLAGAAVLPAGALQPRAVLVERAILRLIPNQREAARIDWIDAGAPAAPAGIDFETRGTRGLTPILFARPEILVYEVARMKDGEAVRGLGLGPGERRLFRSLEAATLPGPIEIAGGTIVNRTGADFAEAFFVRGGRVARAGPLEDGAALGPPGEPEAFSRFAEALDRRGRSGRALRRLLTLEIGGGAAPPGGWLALVARKPAPPLALGDVLERETLPAVYIVALP